MDKDPIQNQPNVTKQEPLTENDAQKNSVELPMSGRSSRLNRRINNESKKQIYLSLLGIIILVFLIFRFGGSVIGFISDFFIGINESQEDTGNNNEQTFVQAPVLNPVPVATDSAAIYVSGILQQEDAKVILFLNNDELGEIEIGKDGAFVKRITGLKEGDNEIKAQAKTKDRKTSAFSKIYTVNFSKKGPDLEVSSPSENQEFKKGSEEITVSGKTNPDSTVTVNGFRAVVDGNGNFSYYLKLNDGENTITIVSTNNAGLSTKKEVKVRYSP